MDMDLIIGFLKLIDKSEAWNLLVNNLMRYKRNLQKFESLAVIGLEISKYFKLINESEMCKLIISRVKWWKVIENCQIPYQQFFKETKTENLLNRLLDYDHLSLKQLPEFCADFNISIQRFYPVYLKKKLINWKPDYEIITTPYGKRSLIMKNNESAIIEQCKPVIELTDDKKTLYTLINRLWKDVTDLMT